MKIDRSVQCRVLTLILTGILLSTPSTVWARTVASSSVGAFAGADSLPARPNVILHQDFDNETAGSVPANWSLANSAYGSFTVDKNVYFGDHGKSAKFVDNSTVGSPGASTMFTPQNGTIMVSLAVRLVSNTGNSTGLEVGVDDGTGSGANIIFGNGSIQYRNERGQLITLRSSYVAERWYAVKLIMDIRDHLYNIHIDEHLEAVNVNFTGPAGQISRILINETYDPLRWGVLVPVGYVDSIEVRRGIVIPADFPTIQDGIDEASPGDVVFVSANRTYFESVIIQKSVWLIGQDAGTTIIDGRFANASPDRIAVLGCSNVTVYGFTISHSAAGGAQIRVDGSGNMITGNTIESGLGDAVRIVGSNNTVADNIIRSNLKCGIRINGSNSTVSDNVIESSDECGIRIVGSYSTVEDNVIRSSVEAGVDVSGSNSTVNGNVINVTGNVGLHTTGSNTTVADNVVVSSGRVGVQISLGKDNLLLNNTMTDNQVGLQFDADSNNSKVYQNRFVGNVQQALDRGRSNKWDDGYPYVPENETGGGNYWSDSSSVDVYSGPNQDEHAKCCLPSPDGICDAPYRIPSGSTDRYPLFLIQGVTQNPKVDGIDYDLNVTTGRIDYDTSVSVTATVLKFVQVVNASIYAEYNGIKHDALRMDVSGSSLAGRILKQSYGTTVRYSVSVRAYEAGWLNSTSYPIPFPYFVQDWTPPVIAGINATPTSPNENQTITLYAVVSEPPGASQVAKVLVSYQVDNTWWAAQMTRFVDDNYTAVFPRQPGKSQLTFTITAFDNAGNNATKSYPPIAVNRLAKLSVAYGGTTDDPCSIDLGTVSGDQKISRSFTISNVGDENLTWTANTIKGGPWLISVSPSSGTVPAAKSVSVTIVVDTSLCPDPSLYAVELSVKANGSVPQWTVIETLTVRYLVIDLSWASSEEPNRCNVGETEYYAFHAKWANNCSDASGGTMALEGMTQVLPVNGTGWGVFSYASLEPLRKTFRVGKVQFGDITAFRVRAPDRTTIWDRVYVNLTLAREWINVNSTADVSWDSSYYESDGSKFKGAPVFSPTPIHGTVGLYPINASSINDYEYRLTAFRSNTVWCVWDEIEIIGGGVSSPQLNVGQTGTAWCVAVYEYENRMFKGANGTLYMNGEPMNWSSDREVWTWTHKPTEAETQSLIVTGVQDSVRGLTRVKDNVGPLSVTWGPKQWWQYLGLTKPEDRAAKQTSSTQQQPAQTTAQPAKVQNTVGSFPWVSLVIILGTAMGIVGTLFILASSGKKHSHARGRKWQKIAAREIAKHTEQSTR